MSWTRQKLFGASVNLKVTHNWTVDVSLACAALLGDLTAMVNAEHGDILPDTLAIEMLAGKTLGAPHVLHAEIYAEVDE